MRFTQTNPHGVRTSTLTLQTKCCGVNRSPTKLTVSMFIRQASLNKYFARNKVFSNKDPEHGDLHGPPLKAGHVYYMVIRKYIGEILVKSNKTILLSRQVFRKILSKVLIMPRIVWCQSRSLSLFGRFFRYPSRLREPHVRWAPDRLMPNKIDCGYRYIANKNNWVL